MPRNKTVFGTGSEPGGKGTMEITITMEEKELLLEILQERRDSFLREISRADNRDFKRLLRRKEQLLESLLSRVRIDVRFPSEVRHVA